MSYSLIQDESLEEVLNINLGKETIGFLSGFKPYSKKYSKVLNGKSCSLFYIQIFKQYQKCGHCINIINQIIENNDCEYFVLSKPIESDLWINICEKIKEYNTIKDFYFKQLIERKDYEIKNDLVLKK